MSDRVLADSREPKLDSDEDALAELDGQAERWIPNEDDKLVARDERRYGGIKRLTQPTPEQESDSAPPADAEPQEEGVKPKEPPDGSEGEQADFIPF